MPIPFLDHIDLNLLEIQNVKLQALSSDPAATTAQIYWNTTLLHPFVHDGTAFRALTFAGNATPVALTVSGAAAVGTSLDAARADHAHAMPGLATTGAAGFMSAADKTKLNAATPSPTVNTIVMRDAAGRAQVNDPVAAQDIATMGYVQTLLNGYTPKANVLARTTGNINLASPGTAIFDGVTATNGSRILVAAQTAPAENGIYIFNGAGAAMTRATDADAWAELVSAYTVVEQGTTYADTGWLCSSDSGGTLGSTAVTWISFGTVTSYTASNDPAITGVGVYDNTSGAQFRFRAIKAGSAKATVTLVAKDIVIDISEANLNLANMGGTLGVAQGGTGATTAVDARTNLGAVGKYAVNIGNGSLTTITINHGLNTLDVTVTLWETGGSQREVNARWQRVDANNVNVIFANAPALNAYRAVVTG